jgi:hypothetical protein
MCCYSCLHIAVQQEKYLPALELFLDFDADVNVTDMDGCNVAYWAIQRFLLCTGEGADRVAALRVLEKILMRGADLDQVNRYGMTARGWLEHAAPEVRDLVARWEAGKPAVRPAHTVQMEFPGAEPVIAAMPVKGPTAASRWLRAVRRRLMPAHA